MRAATPTGPTVSKAIGLIVAPDQGGPQVVVLRLKPVEPGELRVTPQVRRCLHDQPQIVGRVPCRLFVFAAPRPPV